MAVFFRGPFYKYLGLVDCLIYTHKNIVPWPSWPKFSPSKAVGTVRHGELFRGGTVFGECGGL